MKVLYLIHYAGKGGTERYVCSVAAGLRDKGLTEPYFLYTEEGPLCRRMAEAGIPAAQIPLPNRYSLSAARQVASFCEDKGIEVIHTHFLRENYISLLAKRYYPKPRVVYTNHLILPNNLLTRLSNRVLSRRQSAVLAGCRASEEQLIRNGVPKHLITVIHNGVSPEQWRSDGGAALRRSLGIDEETVVLLYSARLVDGKGHAFLLDSLKKLNETAAKPFCLLLAGEGPLEADIRQRAEGLPVHFLGYREDMPDVLNAADVCVNASESETICMSILEGMAAGLPVVATRVGGTGDILGGNEGLLVPYGDTEAMASAIGYMVADPRLRRHAADAAQKTVRERFSLDGMLNAIYSVYQGA